MRILDSLCRYYQSFFSHGYPEEATLVELHQTGQIDSFLNHYFDHEFAKGEGTVARFSECATGWKAGAALDFGCGAGGMTCRIAEVCSEVVGIDIEQYKIDYANLRRDRLGLTNATFICYPGGDLPFGESTFDCIFCVDVVEHLPTPERFIAEFSRVLKPGGQLLLSFGPPWMHPHGKHMWAKLPGWWTHLLFPRSVVMRVSGFPPTTTWEDLGIHRLTVGKFHSIMRRSSLEQVYLQENIKHVLERAKKIPWLRELFISEVVAVYRKPTDRGGVA